MSFYVSFRFLYFVHLFLSPLLNSVQTTFFDIVLVKVYSLRCDAGCYNR